MGNWILQLICTSVFFLLPQFAPAMDNCRGNLFINVMMQNFQLNTPNAQYQLFITSYQDDTNVSITIREDSFRRYYSMTRGMTISVELPSSIEMIGTGKSNKVVTVKSNKSITVLAFSRKRRSSDTTIVYPETSLGTEYWLVTPELGPPDTFKEFAIIAGTKSTSADIQLKGRITFEGLAYEPNTVLTLTLEEGQAVQLQSQDDLTGTKIVSTQPVAVLTGHTCAWKYTRCDHVNEQLLPVSGWGKIYIVAPLSFQSKSDIIYAVANTRTRVDYSVGVVKYTANLNPGETLQIENRNYPVSIEADARIQVMLFCTGGRTSNLEYDTFLMNILSPNAYCRSYFVYGKEDFINYAVIIIKTSGTAKVTFDKKPIPNVNWTAITGTDYSYAEHSFEDSKIAHLVEHPSEPFGLQSVGIASHMAYGSPGTCTETTCDYTNCDQNEICKMVDGEPQCIDSTISTCWIAGDIHYKTFDGVTYNVQGTCSYTIAKSCGTNSQRSSFNIEVENRYKDNGMTSHVSVVKVQVYQHNITFLVSDIGRVRVNGIISSLPITLTGNQIQIYQSGGYVTIDATFGLKVFYDWIGYLQVELRRNYKESVCGMCGNNNNVYSDDFTTPAGTLAQNSKEFAKSWKVDGDQPCQDDCKGPCKDCPPFLTERYRSEDFCGLIAKRDYGPFSQCHTKIDPRNYLDNCVYDVFLNNEDKQAACQSIKTYANACQREGVKIADWRKSAECSLECGPNSQYKLCGPACPNTCEDDTAAAKCRDQCVEGCECNTGFVQTMGKCVPKSTCGCTYKGLRFSKNQVFWDDENCERQCTCNPTTKQVECKESKCKALEKCSVLKDLRSCRPINYGTCVTSANLHFYTFDKYRFDFQGSCVYQFSGLCSQSTNLADFQVNVQSHRKGINGLTFIEGVELLFNGQEIKINRKHGGLVMLNSQYVNLPYHSNDKRIELYKRGSDILIQTDAGIKLTYDWQSRIILTLPVKYAGSVCGLCGDFNGIKTNELTLPNGGNTQSPAAFGDSWKVIDIPGCQLSTPAPICSRLQALKEQQRASGTDCGVIITKDGPFRDCRSKVDPEGFFEDCVYDFCSYKGRQAIFCQTLSSYAAICQLAGATLYPWRMKEFCPMSCPKNSHYEVCSIGCPTTCTGIPSTSGCDPACKEGCTCNAGYVLSGDQCVDLKHCGCVYQGNYYKKDEVFYPNGKCDQKCTCNEGRFVICIPFTCGTNEKCTLVDGTKRCYPVGPEAICSASSPHYQSFDGFLYDFQGNCTYTLAKTCGQSRKHTYFEITVKNEQWGNARVTVPTLVTLKVFNHTVTINHQKTGFIQVNGVEYILPTSLLNGQLKVYMHGTVCIIETDFELTVNYDWGHQVLILVPQNHKGKMCGLCGNFNGNSTEIFLLPEGQLSTDFNEFVSAWTVPSKETCTPVICGDVEFPCSTCNGKKIRGFEKKESCGFLLETEGPLSKCYDTINAHVHFKNCVHDMCTNDSDLKVLCQNIKNYVMECQAAGVTIRPWRNTSFCGIDCPTNSTYKICSHLCDATCAGLVEPWHCSEVCAEGCECDEDYFFDGQQCVTMDRCGCYENGTYYPLEVAVLSDDCAKSCTCRPTSLLICEDHKCKGDEECTTKDGVMKCTKPDACKSTKCRVKEQCVHIDGKAHCIPQFTSSFWAWGDPHYRTLDGMEFDFEGTCTYTIAKYCGNDTALVPFNIEAKNDNTGEKPAISYVRSVNLHMYSMNISINRSDFPKIRINYILSNLPVNINAGAIRAFQSGFTAVIKTDNGIELSYDWNSHLMVTLPSSYYGTTCGLSGNFNQDAADDTADPNGKQVKDIIKWAGSWNVNDRDLTCRNMCPRSCPTCDESKKNRYRSNQFCGLISDDVEGPFRECHSTVIPDKFYDNCLHDVCMNDGANVILCQALRSYASTCLKKNVRIHDWRTPSNCSLICPVNSHYEACGNACPASCMDKSAPDRCTDPCTETCQCDAGFFLSGEECVAVENCGCSFKGSYYKPDQEFWESENCERHCRCDPILGIVECQTTKCKDNLECKVVNGTRGCFLISSATCSAWGDSHYITFDGKYFEFMGDCMYQLVGVISKNPTLTPFIVMVRNDNQGNKTISYIKEVTVKVYGLNVTLSKNYSGRIQVDEIETLLPFHSTKNNIHAFISGNKVVIKTKLGMTVAFHWDNHVSVTIPISYSNAVSGICGDRNGDPSDDLTMKDGNAADNATQFAESWKVSDFPACTTKCNGNCSRCSEAEEQAYKTEEYCGFITKVNGSFNNCHKRIDPTPYFSSCVLDTCKNEGHQPILCSAIKTYVTACQAKGIEIKEWRTPQFCSLVCSGNSHSELCGTGCPATCYGLASPDSCDEECSEGCFCNNGFLMSGDKCVPMKDCGCPYMGRYYQTGQKFYMGNLCHERCRCTENGFVMCSKTSCGANEDCRVLNGVRGCYPSAYGRCVAAGGRHYLSFDNQSFDIRGSCTYTLATICGNRLENFFSVVVNNQCSDGSNVTTSKMVMVSVNYHNISLQQGMSWKAKVNQEQYNLPAILDGGHVVINQEGKNIILRTYFGLEVLYDSMYYVQVTVPSTYKNHMCGLCGNFNGDPSDDFMMPSGKTGSSVDEFSAAWKVAMKDSLCHDSCRSIYPVCNEQTTNAFKGDTKCGLIIATDGPFKNCHTVVNPTNFLNYCLYKMCVLSGNQNTLCSSLQAYAVACQYAGTVIQTWRETVSCDLRCSANSHYEVCTKTCDSSCASVLGPTYCTEKCYEGCECDPGYVFDGEDCVPRNACGCLYKTRYLKATENLITPMCVRQCSCGLDGDTICIPFTCAPDQGCGHRNNVIGCYRLEASCTISNGVDFISFDYKKNKMASPGAFDMAFLCDNASSAWFRVVVEIHQCNPTLATVVAYIFFRNVFIAVNSKREAWLTGNRLLIPAIVNNVISVFKWKQNVIIEAKGKVRVIIGTNRELTVQVWEVYAGQLCGACGNFNENPDDDPQISGGGQASETSEMIHSWRGHNFSGCGD